MNKNQDFIFVACIKPDDDMLLKMALMDILVHSGLPVVFLPPEEAPQPQPLEFQIPDIHVEDFVEKIAIATQQKTPKQNYPHKNYKKTYNQIRDMRNIIKRQTHRTQRIKK